MPLGGSIPIASDLNPVTITGVGRFAWDVTGMASIGLEVAGTAVMTLRYISTSGDPATSTTSNRPWKAGASLGRNIVEYSGAIKTEYRFVGGRKYFVVECTSFTSGSLRLTPYAMPACSIVYVGGGIQTEDEEATIQANVFNAATGFIDVPANNFGQIVFENPAGSNKLALIRVRRFSANANLAFGGISNPTAATFDSQTGGAAPVVLTPSNLRTGTVAIPSPTSSMIVKANVGTVRIDSSPATANPAGDFLLANMPFTLGADYLRIVPPGSRFGHFIGGASIGLGATAAKVSLYMKWEERDLY